MILYNLVCANQHEFEGWFKDSRAFDRQAKAHEVACPVCGDAEVRKAVMAPRINKGRSSSAGAAAEAPPAQAGQAPPVPRPPSPQQQKFLMALREMRKHIETNCDYVGEKFPDEARKIHYGETDARSIYGEATEKQAEDLKDEGIEFHRIPWAPREDA
jgi:hypothetical protein